MAIKRKFGSLIARLLRNGTTLTPAEHAVLCSLVDALPAELRSTVTSQLEAYNLVQREADGQTLNFYRIRSGSVSFVDDLPQINMRTDEGDLVRATLKLEGETEPLHATLLAIQGRLFTLSLSRAPKTHAGRPVRVLDIEQSWRTCVILEREATNDAPSAPVRREPRKAAAAQGKPKKTGGRLYLAAICLAGASVLLVIAYIAWIFSPDPLRAAILTPDFGRGAGFYYLAGTITLLGGLHVPLFPLLYLSFGSLIGGTVVAILIVRRVLIWRRFGSASPPASYNHAVAVLLGICMASLVIALLTMLAVPPLSTIRQFAYVFKLFGGLLVPNLISLPAKYLLGATLLYVEIASIRHEGWWPRPVESRDTHHAAPALRADDRSPRGRARRFIWSAGFRRKVSIVAILVIVIAPFWSVFPTGAAHRHLCNTRAGELVYETARARSFLFLGEGASDDGLHLDQAIEDVANRHVDFIEVRRDSGNHRQESSFDSLFGRLDPKISVLRISIGPAGSANCLKGMRYRDTGKLLQPGECLQYVAVEKPGSRYQVEAVENEQPRWFTPTLRGDGARVIDREKNVLMGEDLNYTNTSLIAFFVLGEEQMTCLPRHGRKPVHLHRKVLLGLG